MANEEFLELIIRQEKPQACLSGPFDLSISLGNNITAKIHQCGMRTISLSTQKPLPSDLLFSIYHKLAKLLMLFDGMFYSVNSVLLKNNTSQFDQTTESLENRLNYFQSKSFYTNLELLSFQNILTKDLFEKWCALLQDLDIAHQIFLYALSDNTLPTDVNFAFLIELSEPFVELIKDKTPFFQSLSPGTRKTTLKNCIEALIRDFGKDIFQKELAGDDSSFLSYLVKSRHRIMHIKKYQKPVFPSDCIPFYSMKFNLLYRRILLDLLGISSNLYQFQLEKTIENINTRLSLIP